MQRGKDVWLIVWQLLMKVGWWDIPLALRDLVEAIPIISHDGLPLVTGNNFQPPPTATHPLLFGPPVYWHLAYQSDPLPLLLRPPLLFGTGEYLNVLKIKNFPSKIANVSPFLISLCLLLKVHQFHWWGFDQFFCSSQFFWSIIFKTAIYGNNFQTSQFFHFYCHDYISLNVHPNEVAALGVFHLRRVV